MEVVFVILSALLPLLLLTYVGMRVELDSIVQFLLIYLGSVDVPPDEAAVLFGLVLRGLFWLTLLPGGVSIGIIIGLPYARQKLWALAALHLHQALMLRETVEAYLILRGIPFSCFALAPGYNPRAAMSASARS